MALDEMARNWKAEYLSAVTDAMANDDSGIRWQAFTMVYKFAGPSRERLINEMRSGDDLRKRGLSAYALIESSNPAKFQILKQMLEEDSELIRFDAVSALAMKGGEPGKQILKQHEPLEKQPRLKELIAKALNGPNV